jgi:hypothetical protein
MPARTFPQGYRDREPVDDLRHAGGRTNLQAKSVPHRLVTSEHPTHLPVAITRQPAFATAAFAEIQRAGLVSKQHKERKQHKSTHHTASKMGRAQPIRLRRVRDATAPVYCSMQIADLREVPHVAKYQEAGLLAFHDLAPGGVAIKEHLDDG